MPRNEPHADSPQTPDRSPGQEDEDVLAVLGSRWTLQIVRTLADGTRRFTEIHRVTGAPRNILTARLRTLESHGAVRRQRYHENPARYEYHLTESGTALATIIRSLCSWGEDSAMRSPAEKP
jgi:DNA-binding HxlR family transcriptional regulator